MIHLMIAPFDEDEVQRINWKLTEENKKKKSKVEKVVDFLKEPEFEKIKSKVKKIDFYFDENDNGEKDLLKLIGDMLKPNPVKRLKLKELF